MVPEKGPRQPMRPVQPIAIADNTVIKYAWCQTFLPKTRRCEKSLMVFVAKLTAIGA